MLYIVCRRVAMHFYAAVSVVFLAASGAVAQDASCVISDVGGVDDATANAKCLLAKIEALSQKNDELLAILERETLPAGTVIAFDTPIGCPSGWENSGEALRGRSIVGASENANDKFAFRRTGGSETHKLSTKEMPSHSHAMIEPYSVSSSRYKGDCKNCRYSARKAKTGSSGAGEAHNNMPPYIALYLCRKS